MLHILNRQGIEELARLFYGFFTQFGQPFGLHLGVLLFGCKAAPIETFL